MSTVLPYTEKQRRLQELSVDDINQTYHDGIINGAQRKQLLIEKAHATTAGLLEKHGYLKAIWAVNSKNVMHGWDNIVEAVTSDVEDEDSLKEMYYGGLFLFGAVQMFLAPINAIEEVNGQEVENMLLWVGAPPGLARFANFVTQLGSAFIPMGTAAKGFAKGVQKAGELVGKGVAKAETAVPKAQRIADLVMSREQVVARDALIEGLRVEGVANAERKVLDAAEAVAAAEQRAALKAERAARREAERVKTEGVPVAEGVSDDVFKAMANRYWKESQELKSKIKASAPGSAEEAAARDAFGEWRQQAWVREYARLKGERDTATYIKLFDKSEASKVPATKFEAATEAGRALTSEFKLPANLAGAKPRYNIGEKSFEPIFESDLDKALYIVAQTNKSVRDADYMRLLQQHFPDMTENAIRRLGYVNVRAALKRIAGSAEPGMINIPDLGLDVAKAAKPLTQTELGIRFERARAKLMRTISRGHAEAELPDLLARFGIDPSMVTRGTFSTKQLYVHLKALEPEVAKLHQLAKAALTGDYADGVAFAKYATELFGTHLRHEGAARIVYDKKFLDLLTYWAPEAVARGDIANAMKVFAADIVNLAERAKGAGEAGTSTLGMFVFGNQRMFTTLGSKAWPVARELYDNLLLTFAWAPAFVGNSTALAVEVLERTAGGMFTLDKARGALAREGLYEMKGMALATGDAFKAFWNVMRHHFVPGATRFTEMEMRNVIPGALGTTARTPRDMTIAMDELTKVIAKRGNAYADALRDSERLAKPANKASFFARRVLHPTDETMLRGQQLAETIAFQNALGHFGKIATRAAQWGPLHLHFPFFKNMINTLKWSWYRTPGLQLFQAKLYRDILAGGVEADRAVGMLTISNLWAMLVYDLAKEGFIMGPGPVDPALNAAWRATNEPYAVKTPDGGHIPISNMEPGSTPVGLIAAFVEIADSLDEATHQQLGMAILYAVMNAFLTNQMSFRTGADLIDIVQGVSRGEDWTGRGLKTLMKPVTTVATFGPLGTRIRQARDPVLRGARSFYEDVAAKSPWSSKSAFPLRDAYADPIIPPQPVGTSWMGFFQPAWPRYKPPTTDRIKLEGERLEVKMPRVPPGIRGNVDPDFDISAPRPGDRIPVPLTSAQQDQIATVFRNLFRHPEFGIEKQLLDKPEYTMQRSQQGVMERTPIPQQREVFEGAMHKYMNLATQAVIAATPELAERVQRAEVATGIPKVLPSDRPGMLEQVETDINLFKSLTEREVQNLHKYGVFEGTDIVDPTQPSKSTIELEIRR